MHKIPPHQERLVNIVVGCLLIFSLLLFAGVPSLDNSNKDVGNKTAMLK